MKTINKYFMMLVSALALTFASCDDGNVGTIYTPSADEKGYTFLSEESNASYTPADTDSIFVIRIARNFTQGSEIVPLIVDGADPLFVIPDSVVFADGEGHADLEIGIKGMATGSTYTFTLAIDTTVVPLASMIADSAKYTKEAIALTEVSLTLDYNWVSVGKVKMISAWAGTEAEVPVENAKEFSEAGNKLYRLNSPYYYLEPTYCPEKGGHLKFILDDDANAVTISPVFQAIGEAASAGGEWFFYFHPQAAYCSFVNEGNVYAMNGAWAYTDAAGNASLSQYANEVFVWTDGWPGKK